MITSTFVHFTGAECTTNLKRLDRQEVSEIVSFDDAITAYVKGGTGGLLGPRVSWEVEDPWRRQTANAAGVSPGSPNNMYKVTVLPHVTPMCSHLLHQTAEAHHGGSGEEDLDELSTNTLCNIMATEMGNQGIEPSGSLTLCLPQYFLSQAAPLRALGKP